MVIVNNNAMALETFEHQGQDILCVPGSSSSNANDLIAKILGENFIPNVHNFGHAVDVILKPNETVELQMTIYKILLPDISNIQLPENFFWYSHGQISTDARCRRDKKFYLRLLEDKPLNVEYSEEQLEKWIDAKILYWRENP